MMVTSHNLPIYFKSCCWINSHCFIIDNASAPIDNSCDIFHPSGGGVSWLTPPEMVQNAGSSEYLISGALQISGVGTEGGTNLDQELLLIAIVTREICLRINDKEGITNPGGGPSSQQQ